MQVSDMAKRSVSLSQINFAMARYLLCIHCVSDICMGGFTHLGGPGFGLISPASRSKMKRREDDREGGINIEV